MTPDRMKAGAPTAPAPRNPDQEVPHERSAGLPVLRALDFEGTPVRISDEHDEPWFVAADVCRALGIRNTAHAVARLAPDEKGVVSSDTPGGAQVITTVNEPGLYRLLFSSRRPEAEAFRRWIAHEVLPAIRRTGAYSTQTPGYGITAPPTYAAALRALADEVEEHAGTKAELEAVAPRLEAWRQFLDADGTLPMGVVANIYGVGRTTLFGYLRSERVLQQDLRPYQRYAHWFAVNARSFERTYGPAGVKYTTTVRPEGLEPLRALLIRRGHLAAPEVSS